MQLKVMSLKKSGRRIVESQNTDSSRNEGVGLNLFSQQDRCRRRLMIASADIELLICCFQQMKIRCYIQPCQLLMSHAWPEEDLS